MQRSLAAVVQRATREELLDAYRDALGRSDWNEVAVRLNGFNDPDITRLVAGYSAATAKASRTRRSPPCPDGTRASSGRSTHEGRGQFTTTIHESMHRFSDAAFQTQLGFNANEGATEYFTRIVCRDQGLSRSGFYESPLASIELLVSTTSREFVADAYFKGAMGLLKIAVDGAKAAGTFDRWKVAIKAGNHARADALLR